MTRIRLDSFRKTLENRKTELESENRDRQALSMVTSADELDRIRFASDCDIAMRNLGRNSDRLREVQVALRRIGAGTFGICASCEEDINPKRLAAVPWAYFCVVCQEAADRGQAALRDEHDTSLLAAA